MYHELLHHRVITKPCLFDISGAHRLPTVQASQALNELQDDSDLYLSTGLKELDHALLPSSSTASQNCFRDLQVSRLKGVLESTENAALDDATETGRTSANQGKFVHVSCLTLPHLMALVSRPNAKAIADRVALMVISNLSALINSSLPKSIDGKIGPSGNKRPTASTKRLQGLQFIIHALQKLAATKKCAVVVSSQCGTRMQSEHGATLVPAVHASVWEQGISTRIVMFRDWAWKDGKLTSIFMAGLQKLDGKSGCDAIERVAPFSITRTGVARVECDASNAPVEPADVVQPKRKLDQVDLEVPDSQDDEDYGWADDDEAALPAPPPQWQGSEDVLLGQELGRSDDSRDEDDDDCDGSHTQSSEAAC
ncbi:hypothetical protein ED733_007995 [Metarhizium rileyi]|uniref:DNA recombination and repair protein Rad51-like C-terminal domain-containing protein n=1 Tax=Metarhizium rileyi (strain RCEF 4871) TaxID=1649241 RepID=A0A5C6GFA9_METRR|nr:hypothetical protein ED733_007995 [Metarhizium rileyi]